MAENVVKSLLGDKLSHKQLQQHGIRSVRPSRLNLSKENISSHGFSQRRLFHLFTDFLIFFSVFAFFFIVCFFFSGYLPAMITSKSLRDRGQKWQTTSQAYKFLTLFRATHKHLRERVLEYDITCSCFSTFYVPGERFQRKKDGAEQDNFPLRGWMFVLVSPFTDLG